MAEWLVNRVAEKLIDTGFDYLLHQSSGPSMKDNLERLRHNLPKIKAVVSNTKRAQTENQELKKWKWQVRDALDEADDFLDDLEYHKLKPHHGFLPNCFHIGNSNKLAKVVENLDEIFAGVGIFLHLIESCEQVESQETRETGSLPEDKLIGRAKYNERLMRWLREEHQTIVTSTPYNNISLLSIVGHGGMGKTTLLQHVYQDEIMNEFGLKMWVCVSDRFDAKKVIKDMLESINHERPSLETLDTLQGILKSKVKPKKFLLVLDDVWDMEENIALRSKWGNVFAPLADGARGSKILITTRAESVASMIANVIRKKKEVLELGGLEEDESLQLLIAHAFVGENPSDHENLKSIAGELVKKLHGSPLAIKVMGGLLNSSLDERHWRNMLDNKLVLDDIIPILKLSYSFLPEHLQSCFSFCSIFAHDHYFDKDDLLRMWIAVGFIQPSHNDQGKTLEDISESYFDDLIKKSFFDKVSDKKYKMHALLYELAQSVSTQECCRFVGDNMSQFQIIPETIRHLSVETSDLEVLKKIERFKNLKTLLIKCHNQSFAAALQKMLQVTVSIRLLHINDDIELELIFENIKYLHHLRYLRFSVYNVQLLPRSLSSLYHLRFIILDKNSVRSIFSNDCFSEDINLDCSNDFFPSDMNNLCNLRYLSSPRSNFPGIGKLKLLQDLYGFCIKNENGYGIEELEHMNELRILGLTNLKVVRGVEEACKAKLCDKTKLTNLFLNWNHVEGDNADPELDERVLESLQPHDHIKTLHMKHYMGARSAIWMKNLEEIYLFSCLNWETFADFSRLKTLLLENMPKVKQPPNKFPLLERLVVRKLEALMDWFDASVDNLFPCVTELELSHCPNLQEPPYLPPKLKSLKINNIGWKTLDNCRSSKSINLEILEVCDCPNITSITLSDVICNPKNLKIKDCPKLIKRFISQVGGIVETSSAGNYSSPLVDSLKTRKSRSAGH